MILDFMLGDSPVMLLLISGVAVLAFGAGQLARLVRRGRPH
ncbi:hypothetical protein [Cognatilysobacter terrigena]|nr:hypothetical protein [Lysobacter terrigena]